MNKFVSVILVISFLLTFYSIGNPSACTADEIFDKFDIAYYKLSVDYLESATVEETDDIFSGVKAIFRTIVNIFKTPQWLVDCVTSTRFLFTAKPVNNKSYGNGHRVYVYTDAYGWLVCPYQNPALAGMDKYYTPRYPDTVFRWSPAKQTFDISGEVPVIGGGVT